MELNVLSDPADRPPWYHDGLRFTCTQCGNCCTGGPGYVWISEVEIARLAEHLSLTPAQVVQRYCRTVNGRVTLKERKMPDGNYDCIFLTADAGAGKATRKTCSIYAVRPLQCRTWPFWPENLSDRSRWERATVRCPGMDHGRHFSVAQIESLRDADDWPDRPPTSGR